MGLQIGNNVCTIFVGWRVAFDANQAFEVWRDAGQFGHSASHLGGMGELDV